MLKVDASSNMYVDGCKSSKHPLVHHVLQHGCSLPRQGVVLEGLDASQNGPFLLIPCVVSLLEGCDSLKHDERNVMVAMRRE